MITQWGKRCHELGPAVDGLPVACCPPLPLRSRVPGRCYGAAALTICLFSGLFPGQYATQTLTVAQDAAGWNLHSLAFLRVWCGCAAEGVARTEY